MKKVIDLRSDTLTLPSEDMIGEIDIEMLGDDGRENQEGRGEDKYINQLEDLAAQLSGKEAALFFPTGTMANHAALLSFCKRGDAIAIDQSMHIHINEKIIFKERFFGMCPIFYTVTEEYKPDPISLERLMTDNRPALLCIENTHNYGGGTVLSADEIKEIRSIVGKETPIFMDGARIFNAVVHLNTTLSDLCKDVDALSFCLSKGLGAPVGSVLCGTKELILQARQHRKLLGGTMRQGGVVAAAGIIALAEENINRLQTDHENALYLAGSISHNKNIKIDAHSVQTNIVTFELNHPTYDAESFVERLKDHGVLAKKILANSVRLITYKGIHIQDVERAAATINEVLKV